VKHDRLGRVFNVPTGHLGHRLNHGAYQLSESYVATASTGGAAALAAAGMTVEEAANLVYTDPPRVGPRVGQHARSFESRVVEVPLPQEGVVLRFALDYWPSGLPRQLVIGLASEGPLP
jgi:hypothetical protein